MNLKSFIKQRIRHIRFGLSARNHPLFLAYYRHLYQPEAGSLSDFLHRYSLSKKGDFFVVQIGANDGITNDPIHKFIKRDSWKGILLEPQPDVFRKYLRPIYARNEGIHTVCAALGEEDGRQTLYKVGFSDMRWATGLASFQRDNLEKAFETGLVASRCEKYGITLPEEERWIDSEEVETVSPQTLLRRYGAERIDLLQIDTEGFDFEVIRMFDISRSQPEAIVFEHIHLAKEDQTACTALLLENGYSIRVLGGNTLAMKTPGQAFVDFFPGNRESHKG